jgi:hypothetical protein
LDGRPVSREAPTPTSFGHHDDDKDIFGTSRKSMFEVSFKEILPISHGTRRLPSRRPGKTAVLTDSPYKRRLENASALKRKLDRKVSCGATTKRGLGMYQTLKKNYLERRGSLDAPKVNMAVEEVTVAVFIAKKNMLG